MHLTAAAVMFVVTNNVGKCSTKLTAIMMMIQKLVNEIILLSTIG